MTNEALLKPEEHVLSTLERDGSRRWLKPKLSQGHYLKWRRLVAWLLIFVFTIIPFLKINGKPLVLLDIPARRFTIFGYTFLPTDTLLLALFMVGLLMSIFLLTALFGRIWCGWACPQTVYMEFVYRPIERLFDGTSGKGGPAKSNRPTWVRLLKYPFYLVVSFYLANTFLAYFVGVEKLSQWVRQSPLEHPTPFLVMAFVTVAMMADFCYFREQVCIIMCPYGRFQSVLLDQSSLIVSYDHHRGEPRGKAKKSTNALPVLGDCVDCGLCVATCPTGIDIRKGLQMECINCTQCIDACNAVMEKLDRPTGLIRYSNQRRINGEKDSFLRPRVIIYPLLLTIIASIFGYIILNKKSFDAIVIREAGNPFTVVAENTAVQNLIRLKLTNRTDAPMNFKVQVLEPADARIEFREPELELASAVSGVFHASVVAPKEKFRLGRADLKLLITNEQGEQREQEYKLIGPQ